MVGTKYASEKRIFTDPKSGAQITQLTNQGINYHFYFTENSFDLDGKTSETIISVTAIVFIFGLPLLIVFTVFFFNYKNRKAKYRLAEQALSSGQQLPEDFFKNAEKTEDIRTKGIKNIFIGIGLFIFLWAITENFGVGCVGLLIMFTGFGQLVIYYTQDSNKKNNQDR